MPNQFVIDGHEFLKQESIYAIMKWYFLIGYFPECCLLLFSYYLSIQHFCDVLSYSIFYSKIYVYHHNLTWVLRLALSRRIFASGSFSRSSNSFLYYLSIQHFCDVLSYSIFYSKIVVSLTINCWLCLCALSINLLVEFFFRYFGMSGFVCIAWPCPGTIWVFLLLQTSFELFLPVVFSDLSVVVFWGVFSFCRVPLYFTFLSSFDCRNFFISPSYHISRPSFEFLFKFLCGLPIFLLTNFAPT